MAAKRRRRADDSKKLGGNGGNEGSHDDDGGEEGGKSGEPAIPAEPKEMPLKRAEERSPQLPEGAGVPARGEVTLNTKKKRKRVKKPRPASLEEDEAPSARGPLPDDTSDAGHDKRDATTPKNEEKRSPPPRRGDERAAEPDAAAAASAPQRKKKKRKRPCQKEEQQQQLTKDNREDEHHDRKMAEQEPSNTSPPQDEVEQQEKKMAEQEHAGAGGASTQHDKDMHGIHEEEQQKKSAEQEPAGGTSPQHDNVHGEVQQEKEVANQEHAGDTSLAPPPSARLNLRSDPERTTFWGVELKPGEPYTLEPSGRCRLRITQATLGNLESVGWNTITCSVGGKEPVKLCLLNSTSVMCKLDLEYDEGQNVVFSVIGDSSVHLAGYKIPDAAANIQALVTQIQEDDDRETTNVHCTAQEHNALGTVVHNDGTNKMVGQAGINVAANVQALVTESQEADNLETTHVHDIARGRNALETEICNVGTDQMVGQSGLNAAANVQVLVTQNQEADDHETTYANDIAQGRTDCTNLMVGQAGLNIMISDEASLGSGHRPVYKDVGGLSDELEIDELKLGDCNAEMASDGKKVKVKYIGRLKDGKVIDSLEGRPDIYTFTLGVDIDTVISGWHQGIKGMRVGGKRKLTIPPTLAYKDIPQLCRENPQKEMIPANSWLVYDIELLGVSEPDEEI